VIQRRIQNPLALAILEGEYGEGDTVRVEPVPGGDLGFVRIAAGAGGAAGAAGATPMASAAT
jgi:hypothetical protein